MASSGSYKYLYERLGDKRFQQLCGALVVDRFNDVSVFPVGEKDGGRDVTSGTGAHKTILQVKWTGMRTKKASSWLKSAIKGEDANIRRLVAEGCKQYILMTNVEGGAAPRVGTRDEITKVLEELSSDYGISMSCVWASDIDAWVDLAPSEIKAAYVDMLAGTDALITLLRSDLLQSREKRERDILVTYVATHWDRDKRVKFRQVGLASDLLADYFVDVTARRTRSPRNIHLLLNDIGEVARHLLDPHSPPLTLIEGVPGQGKSTIAQYVCQVHRAEFIGREQLVKQNESLPSDFSSVARVAIRVDLAEYAEWSEGHDPFSSTDAPMKKAKPRSRIDIERFLVDHVESAVPGQGISIDDIRNILDRFPTQIVLDGLDEVASAPLRERIVREIDEFTSRWVQSRPGNMRLLVTTRPNSSGLSEPAPDIFERIALQPLEEQVRKRYLRRWATAQHIVGAERRALERIFGEQTAAPHVAQLADNPMQLTILLHLIRTKGESLPTARTSLYRSYMDLFLERESLKSKRVLENRADIEEVTSYLGWFMQELSEVDSSSARLPSKRIIREMMAYLAIVEKVGAPVQELFETMRDRVWVLTSKQTGTYEFDVQSIREFFAARFLYEFAQSDTGHEYDPAVALIELLPRAYWANTARFLGGHFQPREIPNVAELIENRFSELPGGRQLQATVWSLLSDGIFKERTASQRRIAVLFAEDLAVRYLASELGNNVSFPALPQDFGGLDLAARLREDIAADVSSPLSLARCIVASEVGDRNDLTRWWSLELEKAAGTSTESAWLSVGRPLKYGPKLSGSTADSLIFPTADTARFALGAGVSPTSGSAGAQALLQWVLDGHCSDVSPVGASEAADLLRVLAPHVLISIASNDDARGRLGRAGHEASEVSQGQRTAALKRLAGLHGNDRVQAALRVRRGEKGTTARWVNAARALTEAYGRPTWLATEIAAIAAAIPVTGVKIGGDQTKDAPCFGPGMDYGQWLSGVVLNRSRESWWLVQRDLCLDAHSRGTWVLGLLAAGDAEMVSKLVPQISETINQIPEINVQALVASSSRIAASGIPRRFKSLELSVSTPVAVRLLFAHFVDDPVSVLGTTPETLIETTRFQAGWWPAANIAVRMAKESSSVQALDLVAAFGADAYASFETHDSLTTTNAEYVLRDPKRFSSEWLALADKSLATVRYGGPLKNHADTEWGF